MKTEKRIIDCIELNGELFDSEDLRALLEYNAKLISEKEKLVEEINKMDRRISAYQIVIDSKKKRGTL